MQDVIAQSEHDDVLHSQVLDYPLHAPRPICVLERPIVLAVQTIHDVPLKLFEQVYLVLQVFRMLRRRVRFANVDRSIDTSTGCDHLPRCDVVKVAMQRN